MACALNIPARRSERNLFFSFEGTRKNVSESPFNEFVIKNIKFYYYLFLPFWPQKEHFALEV